MAILKRREIQDYVQEKLDGLNNQSAYDRSVYDGILQWLEKNPGRVSGEKFGLYLSKEIDWLIDCARSEKRGSGRIKVSTERSVYSTKEVLYNILNHFDLKRIRTLE